MTMKLYLNRFELDFCGLKDGDVIGEVEFHQILEPVEISPFSYCSKGPHEVELPREEIQWRKR